jgi:methionine biosynthesis protein MetW
MSNRVDHDVIVALVEPGARVLDVGCGDGGLLARLQAEKSVTGRGVELSQEGVNACVARGLSVVQGDADTDLSDYPDNSFDYVILSKTIQAVRSPPKVLGQLMRIGRRAIVSAPNIGHWRARLQLLATGRMPRPAAAATRWWDGDSLHLCSVRDFVELARDQGCAVEHAVPISAGQSGAPFARSLWAANWFAEEAVFVLTKQAG